MAKQGEVKVWLAQIRANFLILAVLLVAIGLACSYKYPLDGISGFNFFHAFLLLIGIVLAHTSVNLNNEYSDYKTKIDFNTVRNPFSGGSGMLVEGKTKPRAVLFVSILTLIVSLAIGIYFIIVSHWFLLIFVACGAFAVAFYTNFLAKILLGEFFAGMTLGTFVVLGTYVAMTASRGIPVADLLPLDVIMISIPPGILTSLLLFLNEFPDVEADKQGGRFHLVIALGTKKAAYVYIFGLILTYVVIILIPFFNLASFWVYIALLTIPLAVQTSKGAIRDGSEPQKMIPNLGKNVMIVLGTDLLLAVAVILQ